MDDKDRAEIFHRLAVAAWTRFANRRDYEWRMAFGIWTAYGVATGFLLNAAHPSLSSFIAVLATVIGLVPPYLFERKWIPWLNDAHRTDQNVERFWEHQLETLAGVPRPPSLEMEGPPVGRHQVHLVKIALTWTLASLFVLSIWNERQ
jgi:hypothetical protein